MAIENNLIDTTETIVYESLGGDSAVTTIFVCNYSETEDVKINIHIVPSGSATSDQNRVLKDLIIISTDTFVFGTERILLGSGDKIVMTANTASVASATISYTGI
jgi:hypothetical protein